MNYLKIAEHYDKCFKAHGDTHLGVDWPNERDTQTRYKVMEEIVKYSTINLNENTNIEILDFGCGSGHFFDYLLKSDNKYNINYSGLDINESYINFCRDKYKNNSNINLYNLDILTADSEIPVFDFVILNGVFTEKRELSYDDMMDFFQKVIIKVWDKCNHGISFNLMSKHVDWERDDLFHVSIDELGWFLKNNLSRNFVVRNDYGLYEYTTYVYKK